MKEVEVKNFGELVGAIATTRRDYPISGKEISIKFGTDTISAELYEGTGFDVLLEEFGIDTPNYSNLITFVEELLHIDTPFVTSRANEYKLLWQRNLRGRLLPEELAVEVGIILAGSFAKMSIFEVTKWLIGELRVAGVYATAKEVHAAMMVLEDRVNLNERGTGLLSIGLPKLALGQPIMMTSMDAMFGAAHR